MNLVFVNHTHPDTAHVSSMRMRLFAAALARRGHRIILLTHSGDRGEVIAAPPEVACQLARHDWQAPFHLACPPRSGRYSSPRKLPRAIRRALTFADLTLRGGLHDDWVQGSRPYWPIIKQAYRPDLVWGVFGDPSSLKLAQHLAHYTGAPWVADFKDNFEKFIHPLVRRYLVARYSDAIGFSSNSRLHSDIAAQYLRCPHAVIYSGVIPSMIAPRSSATDATTFRITLIGSLYDADRTRGFLVALTAWLQTLDPGDREHIEFAYAGTQRRLLETQLGTFPPPCRLRIDDQLPLEDLGRLCQSAAVNAYLWSPVTFHHKLLELLACRRPVVSFPGEHGESIELAAEFGGDLRCCTTQEALCETLSSIWRDWRSGVSTNASSIDAQGLTWDAMATKLEAFLVEMSKSASHCDPSAKALEMDQ